MKNHNRLGALAAGLAMIAGLFFCGPAAGWYPSTSQGELLTATWCGNCPEAYAGLDYCKTFFTRQEFNAIRYYDNSGALGNADAQARIVYYGGPPYPRAYFAGVDAVSGGNALIQSGLPYRTVVESRLDDPAHYKITINSYDLTPPTGSIDLTVEVMEDVMDISDLYLRMALTEENISYGGHDHDDVTRDMLDETAITVDETGETQNVVKNFAINAAWTGALEVVAFIQNDISKDVMASAVTGPAPQYAFRYYVMGDRVMVGDIFVPNGLGTVHTYNTGTSGDDFTISVSMESPPDWAVNLCDEGMCYGPVVNVHLAPGEEVGLLPEVFPVSSGSAKITYTITQAGNPGGSRVLEFGFITDDVDILVVDDDWLYEYEDYYAAGLDYFGYAYGIWNRNLQELTSGCLSEFPIVMWSLGGVDPGMTPTLTQSDRDAIAGYLNGGGNLFMSGQDLSSDMEDQGGAAYTWFQNYMHAVHVSTMDTDRTLSGVPGDPVSIELDLTIAGGDGANNQVSPDDIDPAGGSTVIWTWDATHNGAVRMDTGVYKIVFLAFGFEAIDNGSDRNMVLRRVIRWFQDLGDSEDGAPVYRAGLYANPNPVHDGGATLRFTLPESGQASLQVFGPDGRWVRTLASGQFSAGPHVASWDRLDSQGTRVPAGIYWYCLDSNNTHLTQKTVVLR